LGADLGQPHLRLAGLVFQFVAVAPRALQFLVEAAHFHFERLNLLALERNGLILALGAAAEFSHAPLRVRDAPLLEFHVLS